MTTIKLNFEDLHSIWKIAGDNDSTSPFKNIYKFINSFGFQYPEYKSICSNYSWNKDNDKYKDFVSVFCQDFADKISVDEHLLHLLDSLPSDLKTNKCVQILEKLNSKYPDFFNQFTQALEQKNLIKFHESMIVNSWMTLAKNHKISFKGKEVYHFIQETIYDKDTVIIKKIKFLERFDSDKAEQVVRDYLIKHPTNPLVIEAAQTFFEKNNIANIKPIIPLYSETETHLFHYDILFKPEAIIQKHNVSKDVATQILNFGAYYLAEHAYFGLNRNRTTQSNGSVLLETSTPYEHALKDAKAIYQEAIGIVFEEFLTSENILKIRSNNYDETLAKHLKDYIKRAVLKNSLNNELTEKDNKLLSPKI